MGNVTAQGNRILLALNLLRQETSTEVGIKTKRSRAGWDEAYLEKILIALL